ncbi:MAG: HAD family hydrolase [Candidatus Binatia bacterium]|nr:HAD family hydrolase [Candidatus Binatia bacterium]
MFSPDLQALVFDFDRTLAPLGNFVKWREALPLMRERYVAHGVPEDHLDGAPRGCFGLYGHVARGDHLEADTLLRAQTEVSEILAKFEAVGIGKVELFDGAAEMLRALPAIGLRAGIVSSNPEWVIRDVLEHRGVAGSFEAIVGRDGLDHIKPAPEGMLLCCERLGVTPAHCLGVGDNAGDIEASRSAGMPAVGVATGVSEEPDLLAAGALAVYDGIPSFHAALTAWKK